MSTAAQEYKARKLTKKSKFVTRKFSRCALCGRSRSYYRLFKMCRICLRNAIQAGEIPGVMKSTW